MSALRQLPELLRRHRSQYHPVMEFRPGIHRLLPMDLTAANTALTPELLADTPSFSRYINKLLEKAGATHGVGGYNELRTVYGRSALFGPAETTEEPRRLHLGIDIWTAAGTPVFAFMEGRVHSFAFNDHFGDYGATLILEHELDGIQFYSLYGHISLNDIRNIREGQRIDKGSVIAHLGKIEENGHWPPHLHFQLVADLENRKGDYPGVCKASEQAYYVENCPDPEAVLNWNRYL